MFYSLFPISLLSISFTTKDGKEETYFIERQNPSLSLRHSCVLSLCCFFFFSLCVCLSQDNTMGPPSLPVLFLVIIITLSYYFDKTNGQSCEGVATPQYNVQNEFCGMGLSVVSFSTSLQMPSSNIDSGWVLLIIITFSL